MKKLLLLGNLVFSTIGVGQIWLVQLSSYRLWALVGPGEFHAYHIAWWHSIWGPIFIPVGLALGCNIALFWFRSPALPRSVLWVGIALFILTYALTTVWWAPLMALIGASPAEFQAVFSWAPQLRSLRERTQDQLYDLLVATHWFRVTL